MNRRSFLRHLATGAAAVSTASALSLLPFRSRAKAAPPPGRKFLFVISASGGGSILDSLLPVAASEVSTPARAATLLAFPDEAIAQPTGSAIRCVRNLRLGGTFSNDYDPADFVAAHFRDLAVVTVENTSVNHVVAQKRAITGAGIDGGRTIMEAVAMRHGDGLLLPNVNLASGGYLEPGDAPVPDRVRGEVVTRPELFASATHGYRGIPRAPSASVIERARSARRNLDAISPLASRPSALRDRYLELRDELAPGLESADLITKLMLLSESPDTPLSEFELAQSPDGPALAAQFPLLGVDRLQTQAAIAFLLVKHGVSCSVTFGPGFEPSFLPDGSILDTPIAFDFSHNDHVTTQNTMWSRIFEVADGLIRMLKTVEYDDGSTLWDASLIYVATDFGRSKERPAGSLTFGSGHHLNNGNVFVSPRLKGNRVFGGVDPETCLTYGFDGRTGEPRRDEVMREGHLYSLVAHALDVDFAGREDMSGLLR
ncbi:MAG: twin-arginine translocation signal domain-containing protein [Myxococcota bacterium]|jgi:hypothetical protein|nr:twin-arginine translocation signal domain-containing protein [Myxococcota bacterium]